MSNDIIDMKQAYSDQTQKWFISFDVSKAKHHGFSSIFTVKDTGIYLCNLSRQTVGTYSEYSEYKYCKTNQTKSACNLVLRVYLRLSVFT